MVFKPTLSRGLEKSRVPDWETPGTIGINRMAPHTPLHSFTSRQEAVNYVKQLPDTCETGRRIELSGCEWDFKFL